MVACINFFEMSEICRPKFIVRHSTCGIIYINFLFTEIEEQITELWLVAIFGRQSV
jgi:hypothetical protein